MKIYLIEESWGCYEDYFSRIIHAFFSKNKADKYLDDYNENLEWRCIKHNECENYCFYNQEQNLECVTPETQEEAQANALKMCSMANVVVDIDENCGTVFYQCQNAINNHIGQAKIIELEMDDSI